MNLKARKGDPQHGQMLVLLLTSLQKLKNGFIASNKIEFDGLTGRALSHHSFHWSVRRAVESPTITTVK